MKTITDPEPGRFTVSRRPYAFHVCVSNISPLRCISIWNT